MNPNSPKRDITGQVVPEQDEQKEEDTWVEMIDPDQKVEPQPEGEGLILQPEGEMEVGIQVDSPKETEGSPEKSKLSKNISKNQSRGAEGEMVEINKRDMAHTPSQSERVAHDLRAENVGTPEKHNENESNAMMNSDEIKSGTCIMSVSARVNEPLSLDEAIAKNQEVKVTEEQPDKMMTEEVEDKQPTEETV